MSDSLVERLIALPLAERVEIAQALWESIDGEPWEGRHAPDPAVILLARKRAAELSADGNLGRSHEDVMAEVRRALESRRRCLDD